jgi:epoxyqueuosine reductase
LTAHRAAQVERSEWLKAQALLLGFHRVGIATISQAEHGDALVRWLERGDHAGMAWMERRVSERLDVRELVPWARTAVCVALHYHQAGHPAGRTPPPNGDLWPRVARYARGDDYHQLMIAMLDRLGSTVAEAYPGAQYRSYVDTGPVLERELAARAGLGRVGKNTNLLHRSGSWFFLGEVFLDLDLEPDQPLADMCGSCTRCLDACPTGALPEPYRLDSRRCISYWTIEHRGTLPPEVRPWLHDWVFGCDICQEVCPWNSKADRDGVSPEIPAPLRPTPSDLGPEPSGLGPEPSHLGPEPSHLGPEPSHLGPELSLIELAAMTAGDFRDRFAHSPMRRARHHGLARNVVVALGNLERTDAIPVLSELLLRCQDDRRGPNGGSEKPEVLARHAAWALGRIGGEVAVEALEQALRGLPDALVRGEILDALAHLQARAGTGREEGSWSREKLTQDGDAKPFVG